MEEKIKDSVPDFLSALFYLIIILPPHHLSGFRGRHHSDSQYVLSVA
jgi:hypothetical protein